MIRINLLAVERERVRRRATFQLAEKLTVACSLILVAALVFIGWWYWTLSTQAADLDREIAAAQTETARLKKIIDRVHVAEQRRAQIEQRVKVIEELQLSQNSPVRLLDEISGNLPDSVWLTGLTQKGDDITLEGRSLSITGVSELVASLEASPYFKKPLGSPTFGTERHKDLANDLIKFTLKVGYLPLGAATPVAQPATVPAGK